MTESVYPAKRVVPSTDQAREMQPAVRFLGSKSG